MSARCHEEAPIENIELPQPVKFIPNWGRKYSLRIMNLGLACRAIELNATSTSKHDFVRLGVIPIAHGPRQADLIARCGPRPPRGRWWVVQQVGARWKPPY